MRILVCNGRCRFQVGLKELARFSDAYATILKVSMPWSPNMPAGLNPRC